MTNNQKFQRIECDKNSAQKMRRRRGRRRRKGVQKSQDKSHHQLNIDSFTCLICAIALLAGGAAHCQENASNFDKSSRKQDYNTSRIDHQAEEQRLAVQIITTEGMGAKDGLGQIASGRLQRAESNGQFKTGPLSAFADLQQYGHLESMAARQSPDAATRNHAIPKRIIINLSTLASDPSSSSSSIGNSQPTENSSRITQEQQQIAAAAGASSKRPASGRQAMRRAIIGAIDKQGGVPAMIAKSEPEMFERAMAGPRRQPAAGRPQAKLMLQSEMIDKMKRQTRQQQQELKLNSASSNLSSRDELADALGDPVESRSLAPQKDLFARPEVVASSRRRSRELQEQYHNHNHHQQQQLPSGFLIELSPGRTPGRVTYDYELAPDKESRVHRDRNGRIQKQERHQEEEEEEEKVRRDLSIRRVRPRYDSRRFSPSEPEGNVATLMPSNSSFSETTTTGGGSPAATNFHGRAMKSVPTSTSTTARPSVSAEPSAGPRGQQDNPHPSSSSGLKTKETTRQKVQATPQQQQRRRRQDSKGPPSASDQVGGGQQKANKVPQKVPGALPMDERVARLLGRLKLYTTKEQLMKVARDLQRQPTSLPPDEDALNFELQPNALGLEEEAGGTSSSFDDLTGGQQQQQNEGLPHSVQHFADGWQDENSMSSIFETAGSGGGGGPHLTFAASGDARSTSGENNNQRATPKMPLASVSALARFQDHDHIIRIDAQPSASINDKSNHQQLMMVPQMSSRAHFAAAPAVDIDRRRRDFERRNLVPGPIDLPGAVESPAAVDEAESFMSLQSDQMSGMTQAIGDGTEESAPEVDEAVENSQTESYGQRARKHLDASGRRHEQPEENFATTSAAQGESSQGSNVTPDASNDMSNVEAEAHVADSAKRDQSLQLDREVAPNGAQKEGQEQEAAVEEGGDAATTTSLDNATETNNSVDSQVQESQPSLPPVEDSSELPSESTGKTANSGELDGNNSQVDGSSAIATKESSELEDESERPEGQQVDETNSERNSSQQLEPGDAELPARADEEMRALEEIIDEVIDRERHEKKDALPGEEN